MAEKYNLSDLSDELELEHGKDVVAKAKEDGTYGKLLEDFYLEEIKNVNAEEKKLEGLKGREGEKEYKEIENKIKGFDDVIGVVNTAISEEKDYQEYKAKNGLENDVQGREEFSAKRNELIVAYLQEVEGKSGEYEESDYPRLITLAKEWEPKRSIKISDNDMEQENTPCNTGWEQRYDAFFTKLNEEKEGVSYRSEFLNPGLKAIRNEEEFVYSAPGKVSVNGERSTDGWRDQVLLAKKEGIGSVDLSGITNEANMARLYLLSKANGLEPLNMKEGIDLSKYISELTKEEQELLKKPENNQKKDEKLNEANAPKPHNSKLEEMRNKIISGNGRKNITQNQSIENLRGLSGLETKNNNFKVPLSSEENKKRDEFNQPLFMLNNKEKTK